MSSFETIAACRSCPVSGTYPGFETITQILGFPSQVDFTCAQLHAICAQINYCAICLPKKSI